MAFKVTSDGVADVFAVSASDLQADVVSFATQAIAEVDQANRRILGRLPPPTVTVDGRAGAGLAQVNLAHGVIVADWALVSDVLAWIGETLRQRSPVLSGRYRDSHTLFADGVEVEIGGTVPQASEYVFLNPLPYARKIEIGKTQSGRDFVIQVPNRIYERTAADAQARFGNVASIKDTYRAPFAGAILKYVPVRGAVSRAASEFERDRRVPAIVVTLRAA
jgi:hypothetical protein